MSVWKNVPDAGDIGYDGTGSGLPATTVQSAIDVVGLKDKNTQLLYVSKAGSDANTGKAWYSSFLTIQAAINSITDASSTKKYVIKIAAGDYAENVIAKDYVFLVGVDTNATRIVGTSGTLLTFPANSFRMQNIGLVLSTAADGSKCIDATGGGVYVIQNFETVISSAVDGAVCQFMDIDCILFVAAEFLCSATMTGSAAGARDKFYMKINGSTIASIARFAITIEDNDVDDTVAAIYNSSTGRTDIIAESVTINMTNAAYSGITGGFAPFGTGASLATARINNLSLTSAGNGNGYGVYFNSGTTGIAEVRDSTLNVSGFANNYSYFVSANDTLYVKGNIVNSALLQNIAGTLIGETVRTNGSMGIGTAVPNANAILDLTSTTKAFMLPRMTTTQRDAIASPTAGMVIYNSTTNVLNFYNGTSWGAV